MATAMVRNMDMATTMPTRTDLSRSGFSGFLAVVLVGATLTISALPRLVSEFLLMPGNDTVDAIGKRQVDYSRTDLEAVLESRQQARRWADRGRISTDIGLAEILLARGTDAETQTAMFASAVGNISHGLALAPMNAYAWARLAYAEWRQTGVSQRVADYLAMSMYTGPLEINLFPIRIDLAFRHFSLLARGDQIRVLDSLRRFFPNFPEQVAASAVRANALPIARIALLRKPKRLKQFNAAVAKYQKQSASGN